MQKTKAKQLFKKTASAVISGIAKTATTCAILMALSCAAPQTEPPRSTPQAQTQKAPLNREQKTKKLIKELNDKDPGVRLDAMSDLGLMREARAIPFLIKALGDPKKAIRMKAAITLGYIKDAGALPALAKTVDNDPDKFVRYAAADAYLYISGKRNEMVFRLIPSERTRGVTIRLVGPAD